VLAAAAGPLRLGFVPLARERFDLVVGRRDAFEPPFQRLLAYARAPALAARAVELGGCDLAKLGTVVYNGPWSGFRSGRTGVAARASRFETATLPAASSARTDPVRR
jgi:hypothetical protein